MKTLPETVKRVKPEIVDLDEVRDLVTELPTVDLVISYPEINEFKKSINKVRDVVRDELIENRFSEENKGEADFEVDEEGHKYLEKFGARLQAQRRVKERLNEDRAKEILEEQNLLGDMPDKVEVPDAKDLREELIALADSLGDGELTGDETGNRIRSLVDKHFTVEKDIDEEKLESLFSLDFISKEQLVKMFDVKEGYSLRVKRHGGGGLVKKD